MENISAAAKSLNTSSSAMLPFSSRTEGIALCSAFVIEAVLIVLGNLLTIVLFALKKRLRKKSLFLVVNMAFCRCHVRSCIASLFCLLGRRSSISTMEYIL